MKRHEVTKSDSVTSQNIKWLHRLSPRGGPCRPGAASAPSTSRNTHGACHGRCLRSKGMVNQHRTNTLENVPMKILNVLELYIIMYWYLVYYWNCYTISIHIFRDISQQRFLGGLWFREVRLWVQGWLRGVGRQLLSHFPITFAVGDTTWACYVRKYLGLLGHVCIEIE